MTTQYTSILKLALPVQGELSGTWGDVVNDNITSMVEEAVAGRAVINTWTTNSHVLTTADGTTAESRCAMLEFTDTGAALTGAATVVCPSLSKLYVCKNDAGQQVTIKTSAGTGVAIPDGQTMFVFCDGTNVEQCTTNFNSLSFNDYTLSFGGAVTTAGAFTTSGAYALTLTTTGATNVTLPTTGTLATLDGTETLTNKTLTAPTISSPTLTGSISATDLTISGDTTIGDAAADGLTVNATVTSNLIFTDNTYDIGAAGATRPRNLYLAGNATIGGTVTLSGGIDVTGALGVDGDFDVNTDKFTVASASGNTAVAGTLGVTGATTATGGLNVDTINEITAAGGVTIDSVLLKDGGATLTGNLVVDTNTLYVDSSTNKVSIGTTSSDGTLHVHTGSAGTVTAAAAANDLVIESDNAAGLSLLFDDTNTNSYGVIYWGNETDGSADGRIEYFGSTYVTSGDRQAMLFRSAAAERLRLQGSAVVVNEPGNDTDFRVESASLTHAFFVDAGSNAIGINNSAPSGVKLSVHGQTTAAVAWGDTSDRGFLSFDGSGNPVVRANLGLGLKLQANASTDIATFGDPAANYSIIFNDSGSSSIDFRVESNSNENMLFVDAGNNKVNVGGTTPYGGNLNVHGAKNVTAYASDNQIAVTDTTALAAGVGGAINFNGVYTTSGDVTSAAVVEASKINATSAHWGFGLNLRTRTHGANSDSRLYLDQDNTVFNETGADTDFRVESDTNTHALFLDAGNSRVGINKSAPDAALHVIGPADTSAISTSSTPAARINNGGANSVWIGANDYNYSYIQAIQDDGTNNIKPIVLQPLGGNVGVGITSGISAFMHLYGNFEGNYALKFDNTQGTGQVFGVRSHGVNGERLAFYDVSNSVQKMAFANSGEGTIFNEDGADNDFRVESDAKTHMLFVDAGNNVVSINNAENQSAFVLNVVGTNVSGGRVAKLAGGDVNTSTATSAPNLVIENNNTTTGNFSALAFASSNGGTTAFIGAKNTNHTTHSGDLYIATRGPTHGYLNKVLIADSTMVINDSGVDYDFRVESANNTHMLFVDAGNDVVGINTSSPGATLDVVGGDSRVYNSGGGVVAKSRVSTGNQTDAITSARTTDANGTRTGFMANAYPDASYSSTVSRDDTDFSAAGWQYYTLNSTYENQTSAILKFENVAGTEYELINASFGEVIVNQGARSDIDFRVESSNNTHMLYVDAGLDGVGIRNSTPQTTMVVNVDGASGAYPGDEWDLDKWFLVSDGEGVRASGLGITHGETFGTKIVSIHPYSSWRDLDLIGDTLRYYNGGTNLMMSVNNSNIVFNENSLNADFRVESDSVSNMLFVNAGDDAVGVRYNGWSGSSLSIKSTSSTNNITLLEDENVGDGSYTPFYQYKVAYIAGNSSNTQLTIPFNARSYNQTGYLKIRVLPALHNLSTPSLVATAEFALTLGYATTVSIGSVLSSSGNYASATGNTSNQLIITFTTNYSNATMSGAFVHIEFFGQQGSSGAPDWANIAFN